MNKIPTIGFISAPAWFDPAPAEFTKVVVETVRTQQAPLLLPKFDYRLDSVASVHNELNLCAKSIKAKRLHTKERIFNRFAGIYFPIKFGFLFSKNDVRPSLASWVATIHRWVRASSSKYTRNLGMISRLRIALPAAMAAVGF
jgi:hypothetical protein